MKPVRRSRECWFKLFKQHEKSGLSMKAFCKPLNINPKYFSLRRGKLGFKNNQFGFKARAFTQVSPVKNYNVSSSPNTVTFRDVSGASIEFNHLPPAEYLLLLMEPLK